MNFSAILNFNHLTVEGEPTTTTTTTTTATTFPENLI